MSAQQSASRKRKIPKSTSLDALNDDMEALVAEEKNYQTFSERFDYLWNDLGGELVGWGEKYKSLAHLPLFQLEQFDILLNAAAASSECSRRSLYPVKDQHLTKLLRKNKNDMPLSSSSQTPDLVCDRCQHPFLTSETFSLHQQFGSDGCLQQYEGELCIRYHSKGSPVELYDGNRTIDDGNDFIYLQDVTREALAAWNPDFAAEWNQAQLQPRDPRDIDLSDVKGVDSKKTHQKFQSRVWFKGKDWFAGLTWTVKEAKLCVDFVAQQFGTPLNALHFPNLVPTDYVVGARFDRGAGRMLPVKSTTTGKDLSHRLRISHSVTLPLVTLPEPSYFSQVFCAITSVFKRRGSEHMLSTTPERLKKQTYTRNLLRAKKKARKY